MQNPHDSEADERALLTEAVRAFNARQGRLRVSITPACQLMCSFCHMEGNKNHWAKEYMTDEFYQRLLLAFVDLGGLEVNVTGGEPLLHPRAPELLRFAGTLPFYLTLSTNGLLLKRLLAANPPPRIDQLKVSLHATETVAGRKYLGRAWNYEKVRDAIAAARDHYRIIINFTCGRMNYHEVEGMVRIAQDLDVDLKFIDIGWTDWNDTFHEENSEHLSPLRALLSKLATYLGEESDKIGATISVFRLGSSRILLRDTAQGRFHTGMCNGCSKRNKCSEGVFALRVNSSTIMKPCLLRDEFDFTIKDAVDGSAPPTEAELRDFLVGAISRMMGNEPSNRWWRSISRPGVAP